MTTIKDSSLWGFERPSKCYVPPSVEEDTGHTYIFTCNVK